MLYGFYEVMPANPVGGCSSAFRSNAVPVQTDISPVTAAPQDELDGETVQTLTAQTLERADLDGAGNADLAVGGRAR